VPEEVLGHLGIARARIVPGGEVLLIGERGGETPAEEVDVPRACELGEIGAARVEGGDEPAGEVGSQRRRGLGLLVSLG
jgi:hypothetical protein